DIDGNDKDFTRKDEFTNVAFDLTEGQLDNLSDEGKIAVTIAVLASGVSMPDDSAEVEGLFTEDDNTNLEVTNFIETTDETSKTPTWTIPDDESSISTPSKDDGQDPYGYENNNGYDDLTGVEGLFAEDDNTNLEVVNFIETTDETSETSAWAMPDDELPISAPSKDDEQDPYKYESEDSGLTGGYNVVAAQDNFNNNGYDDLTGVKELFTEDDNTNLEVVNFIETTDETSKTPTWTIPDEESPTSAPSDAEQAPLGYESDYESGDESGDESGYESDYDDNKKSTGSYDVTNHNELNTEPVIHESNITHETPNYEDNVPELFKHPKFGSNYAVNTEDESVRLMEEAERLEDINNTDSNIYKGDSLAYKAEQLRQQSNLVKKYQDSIKSQAPAVDDGIVPDMETDRINPITGKVMLTEAESAVIVNLRIERDSLLNKKSSGALSDLERSRLKDIEGQLDALSKNLNDDLPQGKDRKNRILGQGDALDVEISDLEKNPAFGKKRIAYFENLSEMTLEQRAHYEALKAFHEK
ncbi:MAG: hypothetical protein OEY79_02950, partial [Anaplasmataceae bacterium]|nr:hypothetical protein [Anaplasmataceae bacterium]